MIELNENNFEQETSSGLVLLDFYADWCGPCRMLAPTLAQLTGIKVAKVNVDSNQALAAQYQVSSIPKLVFLKDGQVVDETVGVQTKETLQAKVNALGG